MECKMVYQFSRKILFVISTVSQNNDTDVAHYNFDEDQPI